MRLDLEEGSSDSLAGWLEAYFAVEVTTAASSRAVQRHDLTRFVRFMLAEEGSDGRSLWTSPLSRAFLDALHKELDANGSRRFSDRTIAAHLKTFAKWIHRLRPFRLGDPKEKLKSVLVGPGLEIERALTESPAAQAARYRRPSPHPRREIKRSPPLERRRVCRRASPPQGLPAVAQPGDRLLPDRDQRKPTAGPATPALPALLTIRTSSV